MSQTCVDLTFFPSGKLMMSGLVAMRLLTTSTPSIIKMDVAPVSAIARFRPIITALITVVNGDNVTAHIGSHAGSDYGYVRCSYGVIVSDIEIMLGGVRSILNGRN